MFPDLPFPLVRNALHRTDQSCQGRALGAAQRTIDGEDRSEKMEEEGKERWAQALAGS